MQQSRSIVVREANIWVLRLEKPNGRVQEYRCTTEKQARQFALLLALPVSEPLLHHPPPLTV